MKNKSVPPAERLAGIEWMRGISAFGVICIHSGLAVHNQTTPAAGFVRDAFGFAVPFFLLTSFFFAIRAEQKRWVPWGDWLKDRAWRLLLPFVFWSAVYLALHIAKFVLHHQNGQIAGLFADPVALILSGGTSVALYFLPLLFTGLLLIHALSGMFRKSPSYFFIIGLIVSLGLWEICSRNGIEYDTDTTGSGPAPVRLLLALIGETARCAPLIFLAGLLTRHLPLPKIQNAALFLGGGLVLLIALRLVFLPGLVLEPLLALGAFSIGWGLSGLLPASKPAMVVGLFSFGVYLVHQIFLELIQIGFSSSQPAGVVEIFAITAAVYAVSMLTVGLASRCGGIVGKIFGLK